MFGPVSLPEIFEVERGGLLRIFLRKTLVNQKSFSYYSGLVLQSLPPATHLVWTLVYRRKIWGGVRVIEFFYMHYCVNCFKKSVKSLTIKIDNQLIFI